MKLGTHVPDGERRKPIDNEVCRTKVKVTTSKNRTQIWYFFRFHIISLEQNIGSKWNLVHTCLMVRGGSLLILRFVGQKSRSYCPFTCSQLGFHTFGALLIFFNSEHNVKYFLKQIPLSIIHQSLSVRK